jgi:hypothetical protein
LTSDAEFSGEPAKSLKLDTNLPLGTAAVAGTGSAVATE